MQEHTTQEIPYGYCQCGCGQKTNIAKRTDNRFGHVKGQPIRFILGHNNILPRASLDKLTLPPGTRAIALTQGKVAVVDEADYAELSKYSWCAIHQNDKWYAARRNSIGMHRFLLNAPDGMEVDHKDGDGLNNTRDNLRVATHSQNQFNRSAYVNNTSGFKGVSQHKLTKRWQATIRVDGKQRYLGLFDSAEEAAAVYDDAAREFHGRFARPNSP